VRPIFNESFAEKRGL